MNFESINVTTSTPHRQTGYKNTDIHIPPYPLTHVGTSPLTGSQ